MRATAESDGHEVRRVIGVQGSLCTVPHRPRQPAGGLPRHQAPRALADLSLAIATQCVHFNQVRTRVPQTPRLLSAIFLFCLSSLAVFQSPIISRTRCCMPASDRVGASKDEHYVC